MVQAEVHVRSHLIELVLYTVLAFSAEDIFIGIGNVVRSLWRKEKVDWKLPCCTNLWSFPVYAVSATFAFNIMDEAWPNFYGYAWWQRGVFYAFCTYLFEFSWGFILEETVGECPWRYRKSSWRIWRYIKPEYVGLWFLFGFALEWIHLRALPIALAGLS
jgi:hypothetical protein